MMVNRTRSNSGAIDFNIMIIIANHPGVILKDPIQAVTVCCVGVLGSTLRTACVLLAASTSILITGSTSTDFAVCQDFRTAGPFTLVRAQHGPYRFTTCWYRLAISASEVIR